MSNIKLTNKEEFHSTTEELYKHMYSILEKYYHEPIEEILETSAGDGRLIDYLNSKGHKVKAYDIVNRTGRADIEIGDYLKTKIEYKKGRVTFQNPPFAKGIKFIYKALEESDYCVSILALSSFLNLDYEKYEVDTIDIFRNYDFGSCKTSICIVGIRKK